MVVLEVRILDKLGATYGPSFESMRRSGPPNQPPVLASSRKMATRSWRHLRFEGCGSRAARPNKRRRPARNQDEGQGKSLQRGPAALPRGAPSMMFPDISLAPAGTMADLMPRQS